MGKDPIRRVSLIDYSLNQRTTKFDREKNQRGWLWRNSHLNKKFSEFISDNNLVLLSI